MIYIRNDDVGFDTALSEIQSLCEICDRHEARLIQCITPLGAVQPVHCDMNNDQIVAIGGHHTFADNGPVMEYLLKRDDLIAIHGLWHTHAPSGRDIQVARAIVEGLGFCPTYYVPPFNEGEYPPKMAGGLKVLQRIPRLEDFLDSGAPVGEVSYLHSWRFEKGYGGFSWERLDKCLARITKR